MFERAVIIAGDGHLNLRDVLPLQNLRPILEPRSAEAVPVLRTKSELREMERATLIRALEDANWKVAGALGAARKLGIPPSTLASRIKSLGIQRPK